MVFTMRRLNMELVMMILRIVYLILLACVGFGSSMAIATERDLMLPDSEVKEMVAGALETVGEWEEQYQQYQDSMKQNEVESKEFAHALDQEYVRLEQVSQKVELLHDVVKDYAAVEKHILRMIRYVRAINRKSQRRSQCGALWRSLVSSRGMVNVGYQLNNRAMEVMVLILALSYMSDSCQDKQEIYMSAKRIEEQLFERRRALTRHKETLRQWISVLREEADKG